MGLFRDNLANDVILTAEYIRVALRSSQGIETIVFDVSRRKFGRISRLFSVMLSDEKKGKPIREIIEETSKRRIHPYVKALLVSLLSGPGADEELSNLVKNILKDKKMEAANIGKSIGMATDWLIIIPFLPMGVALVDLINKTLQDMPSSGMAYSGIVLPGEIRTGVLVIGMVGMLAVLLFARIQRK